MVVASQLYINEYQRNVWDWHFCLLSNLRKFLDRALHSVTCPTALHPNQKRKTLQVLTFTKIILASSSHGCCSTSCFACSSSNKVWQFSSIVAIIVLQISCSFIPSNPESTLQKSKGTSSRALEGHKVLVPTIKSSKCEKYKYSQAGKSKKLCSGKNGLLTKELFT